MTHKRPFDTKQDDKQTEAGHHFKRDALAKPGASVSYHRARSQKRERDRCAQRCIHVISPHFLGARMLLVAPDLNTTSTRLSSMSLAVGTYTTELSVLAWAAASRSTITKSLTLSFVKTPKTLKSKLIISLLLVVRPGAPSSVFAPSSDVRSP